MVRMAQMGMDFGFTRLRSLESGSLLCPMVGLLESVLPVETSESLTYLPGMGVVSPGAHAQ